MKLGLFKFLFLALLLSVGVGLLGSALSKSVSIDPLIKRLGLVGVARDGWIEAKSQLDLSKYEKGISQILFSFNAWRPRGQNPAKMSFEACGKEIGSNQVTVKSANFWLIIPDDCSPDSIDIITKNPFRTQDGRQVGVRLSEVTLKYHVSQKLHFDTIAIITTVSLLFLFLSLYLLGLPAPLMLVAMSLFSVLALLCLRTLGWDNQWQLLCLAVTFTLFALGLNSKFIARNKISGLAYNTVANRESLFVVALIFVLGAIVRFYGVSFGLPNHYHPDEPRKAQIILRMATVGDLDPDYFLHPTLLLYLSALYGKIGYLLGFFSELNITNMNLSGRLVSATAGALSVPVLFVIGRELFSNKVGLLASLVFAFSPLSVTCSRYFKEDSLLTFFVLLTVMLCVKAVKRDRPRDLLLAGFVAGLSSSSKYSGVMSCVAILLAPWLKSRSPVPDSRFFVWGALSAIFVPVGFVIASPYAVLNYTKFHNHLFAEQEHMIMGHHKVIISSWSQYWMYHLSRSIIPAVTWPVAIVSVFGAGVILRNTGMKGLYILALFLAFYLPVEGVNAKPPPQPERYILPCVPFLILIVAFAVDNFKALGNRSIALLLAILVVAFPVYRSVGLASDINPDTRVLMRDWVIQNIPHGKKIVVDAQAYSAFLPQDKFNVELMWSIPQRRGMTFESLKADGVDYILLTNKSYERYFLTQSADQLIRARFEDIFDNWVLTKEFKSDFGNYGFSNPDLSLYKVERKTP